MSCLYIEKITVEISRKQGMGPPLASLSQYVGSVRGFGKEAMASVGAAHGVPTRVVTLLLTSAVASQLGAQWEARYPLTMGVDGQPFDKYTTHASIINVPPRNTYRSRLGTFFPAVHPVCPKPRALLCAGPPGAPLSRTKVAKVAFVAAGFARKRLPRGPRSPPRLFKLAAKFKRGTSPEAAWRSHSPAPRRR